MHAHAPPPHICARIVWCGRRVVEALARKVPRSLDELRRVEGLAETKITSFGGLILQVIL